MPNESAATIYRFGRRLDSGNPNPDRTAARNAAVREFLATGAIEPLIATGQMSEYARPPH